ncbi:MAG: hypothetical protein RL557_294 [archaeon]|jgi:Rad3-related DNA helicase
MKDNMWSLYEQEQALSPLVFSNGKTQQQVVEEVLTAISEGYKLIFIAGMCGTGKSAIALNLARVMGKTSIVVPIKSLQEQYTKDYSEKLHVMDKTDKQKLKISSIVGRQNFKCKYREENLIPEKYLIREKNARLSDTFLGRTPSFERSNDESCDNELLPCKIEIKEKHFSIIKDYLKQNPGVKLTDFSSIHDVKRISIAPVCPYWSPILPREFDIHFKDSKKISYKGLDGLDFVFHQRKPGCTYYGQYTAYSEADVIIFNSLKYKIETLMNRKPSTELEIIDECDEFLDSFANQEKISLNRLLFALNFLFSDEHTKPTIDELTDITNALSRKYTAGEEVYEVKGSLVEELIKKIIAGMEALHATEIDENNYLFHVEEVALTFAEFIDETFFSVEKKDEDLVINLVTTNLKKRFEEMVDKNKVFVLMSGTLHSPEVLKHIFGIEHYKVIEAETNHQGDLIKCKHGYEIDCKFSNFQSEKISREQYLKTFSKTVASAKKPIVVHLTSFNDLPNEHEKERFELDNLPTQQEVIREQEADPLGERVKEFKQKKFPILFTTKCSRGIDFPGDTCNSIIISRFPYPNISSLFWKILKKTHPQYFMDFYLDKAHRELLQKIYRGLRSKNDRVYLLSPDVRVLNFEM